MVADTRKAGALLAYLAVEGVTRRDVLATLLWPEASDAQARATLRRTLSALRTAAGPEVIVADRDQVRLTGEARSDVAEFTASLTETQGHDHGDADVCNACIPALERAVGLYRGDFMAGFALRGVAEYEDWIRTTAESFRLGCGRALENLASAHAARGDYGRAIAAVNSWIDLDPLREPAYRHLMLLYAWSGDRAGAMAAYRRCVAVLDVELGVDPLEETTELHEAILDDDLPPAPSNRRRVAVKALDAPALAADLIDRDSEMRALANVASDHTGGRIVRLGGEPWMGKTRLIEEMLLLAQDDDRIIARARAYRAESGLAYGVVRQLLSSLASSPSWHELMRRVPEWAILEAARVDPELGQPPAGPADQALGESRLFDALFALFTAAPILVVVDDTQWTDPASMSFLTFLANRIATTSASLVFAHRLADASLASPLLEAASLTTADDLILVPLTEDQLLPYVKDSAEARTLTARTGGVPALVTEALEAGGEQGTTPGVRRFMEVQLSNLDDLTSQVMVAAAILHGRSDIDLLQATSGRSDEEVTSAAETLLARGIFDSTPDGEVGFRLDAMEQLVYEGTSLVRRRLLHRRAAGALEAAFVRAPVDAASATRIATHYRAGGEDTAAADWYLRAGDLARTVFANAEAADSYRSALALGHPRLSQTNLALGEVLLLDGQFSAALTEFEKAAAHGKDGDRALAEHRIGECHRRLGRLEQAIAHFEEAREDHPAPADLYCDWALALLRLGDRKGARERADRAVAAAEGAEAAGKARARSVLGMVTPHRAEGEKMLREALELAAEDPIARMGVLNALAHNLAQSGQDTEPVHLVREALDIAARIGDRHRRGALFNHLADLHHRAGRRADAEAAVTESVKLLVEVEPGSWQPEVWMLTRW